MNQPAQENQHTAAKTGTLSVILHGRKLCLAGRGLQMFPDTKLSSDAADSLLSRRIPACPVFFWPMSEEHGQTAEDAAAYVCSRINAMTRETDRYLLAAFTVTDWNRELSPWEAEIPEIGQSFGNGAEDTLRWILTAAMPYLEAGSGCQHAYYLAGYSLAGLFALWGELVTRDQGTFAGAAGCSASMWFPGWLQWAASRIKEMSADTNDVPQQKGRQTASDDIRISDDALCGSAIYLSLGGKEHLTSNTFIAGILDAMSSYEKLVSSDPLVRSHILEMNRGGHFSDPERRVAKGIAWLLKHSQAGSLPGECP